MKFFCSSLIVLFAVLATSSNGENPCATIVSKDNSMDWACQSDICPTCLITHGNDYASCIQANGKCSFGRNNNEIVTPVVKQVVTPNKPKVITSPKTSNSLNIGGNPCENVVSKDNSMDWACQSDICPTCLMNHGSDYASCIQANGKCSFGRNNNEIVTPVVKQVETRNDPKIATPITSNSSTNPCEAVLSKDGGADWECQSNVCPSCLVTHEENLASCIQSEGRCKIVSANDGSAKVETPKTVVTNTSGCGGVKGVYATTAQCVDLCNNCIVARMPIKECTEGKIPWTASWNGHCKY